MRRERPVDGDVAAVMAGNPILAWRAGCSFWMSVMSMAFLLGVALASAMKGSAETAGKLAICLGVYGVFWVVGLSYGGGEGAKGSVEPNEAYRGAFALRAAMLVSGFALAVWWVPDTWPLGEAMLSAGLWMGAFVESGCVRCVAREHGLSIRKGLRVSCCVAGVGSRKAVGEAEEVESDG